MKKLFKIFLALMMLFASFAMAGCGSLDEEDLPDKSKEVVVEFLKGGGFVKPDAPYSMRFGSAWRHSKKFIDNLEPEFKEILLDPTVEVKRVDVMAAAPTPNGTIIVPIRTEQVFYYKSMGNGRKYPGVGFTKVYWTKEKGKWVIEDIVLNKKSQLDKLEGLEYNYKQLIAKEYYARKRASME